MATIIRCASDLISRTSAKLRGGDLSLSNIDQIRQAERERQELSETLASLFDQPDAVLTVNAAGQIERVSEQAEKMFGSDRRELVGSRSRR